MVSSNRRAGVTVTGPTRVFGDAALGADGRVLWHGSDGWTELTSGPDLLCAVDAPGGLLIGTEGAHLTRVSPTGLARIESFETTGGRDDWYTPWGGAPETRSLDAHRRQRAAREHPCRRHPPLGRRRPDLAPDDRHRGRRTSGPRGARTARPRARRRGRRLLPVRRRRLDLARRRPKGLHATYCRAVAIAGDAVLLSASEGPRGRKSALYRRGLGSSGPFERVTGWIEGNIDTHALDALGERVVFGTRGGRGLGVDGRRCDLAHPASTTSRPSPPSASSPSPTPPIPFRCDLSPRRGSSSHRNGLRLRRRT